jgi:hypothetical protein
MTTSNFGAPPGAGTFRGVGSLSSVSTASLGTAGAVRLRPRFGKLSEVSGAGLVSFFSCSEKRRGPTSYHEVTMSIILVNNWQK